MIVTELEGKVFDRLEVEGAYLAKVWFKDGTHIEFEADYSRDCSGDGELSLEVDLYNADRSWNFSVQR